MEVREAASPTDLLMSLYRELDLSGFVYAPNESSSQSAGVEGQGFAHTRQPGVSSSSRSRQMDVLSNAGNFEDPRERSGCLIPDFCTS